MYSCCSDSIYQQDTDPYRFNYPEYNDGHTGFCNSPYHDNCGDDDYWTNIYRLTEFTIDDSIFLLASEEVGFNGERPNPTSTEEAELISSNDDIEKIIFDLPYPHCIHHIEGFYLLFGSIKSKKGSVLKYNGTIDIDEDTIEVIANYKSYWTGKIVNDTAYVLP
ncbi:MAG: hypothetical protein JXR46_16825 [Calditrichaceae bacterium]|nr:hypothetical protein [Calditrichaceae bacterium]MBN2710712.1 hypothetical protein [Calditrichaceae bacterium]RQV92741.1 MAG: hypothetical protein EH224_14510 [Calditrichota bacterium]